MATPQEVAELFPAMASRLIPAKAQGVNATIQFNLTGDNGGLYWIKVAEGKCEAGTGAGQDVKMTLKVAADDWYAIANNKMSAMTAFMTGKIKIEGDMNLAMKMQTMFAT